MTNAHELNDFDMAPATLEREWVVTIDTPMGSRSKLPDDKDNPNRYWNRKDAGDLHGEAVG